MLKQPIGLLLLAPRQLPEQLGQPAGQFPLDAETVTARVIYLLEHLVETRQGMLDQCPLGFHRQRFQRLPDGLELDFGFVEVVRYLPPLSQVLLGQCLVDLFCQRGLSDRLVTAVGSLQPVLPAPLIAPELFQQ